MYKELSKYHGKGLFNFIFETGLCGAVQYRSYMFPEADSLPTLSAVCGHKSEIQFYPHKQYRSAKTVDTWSQLVEFYSKLSSNCKRGWKQYVWVVDVRKLQRGRTLESSCSWTTMWRATGLLENMPLQMPRFEDVPGVTVWEQTAGQTLSRLKYYFPAGLGSVWWHPRSSCREFLNEKRHLGLLCLSCWHGLIRISSL